jgi:hypothetical protein
MVQASTEYQCFFFQMEQELWGQLFCNGKGDAVASFELRLAKIQWRIS